MKDLKNWAIIIIPFCTICGALYHMSYWATFDLNGLEFITVSDILKSAAYPLFLTYIPIVFGIFPGFLIGQTQKVDLHESENDTKGKLIFTNGFVIGAILLIDFVVCYLVVKYSIYPTKWTFVASLFILPTTLFIFDNKSLRSLIVNDLVRGLVVFIGLGFPTISLARGRCNAEYIYQNQEYKFTISGVSNNDTLKLIGKTEKNWVFSNLENTKIVLISSENIDTLVLFNHSFRGQTF